MKHPTGKLFLYFLAAGLLLVASIPLTSVLQPAATTFKSFILSVMVFVFVPFIFVPQLIFHFTSGVPSDLVEERLKRKLETDQNHYARDSFAAVLEILGTPRARQALQPYTAWQPERIKK